MSISLKNITPADTISSMVDKINFNFDQILLNGGGIEGPKGDRGYPGMQGVLGSRGERGLTGDNGQRGTLWFKLSDDNISTALIYGFTTADIAEMGGDVMVGDIVVSTTTDTSDSASNGDDVASKLYKVIEDTSISSETGLKPEFFANFVPNEFFEEHKPNGVGENSIIRTTPSGSGYRAFVLNDYHRNLNLSNTLLNEIINNNAAIVYTQANSEENSVGSPNTGIVFIKDGDTYNNLGDYPRINYIKSNNNVDQLNINAPGQSLTINSGENTIINANNITCRINSQFELTRVDNDTFTYIKTEKDSNDKQNLYLSADVFKFGKIIGTETTSLLDVSEENSSTCKINIKKQNTNIVTSGSLSIKDRILINKSGSSYNIDIISGMGETIKLGDWVDYDENWPSNVNKAHGIIIKRITDPDNVQRKQVIIQSSNYAGPTITGVTRITLDSTSAFATNIKLEVQDRRSIQMSNLSEEYGSSILNIGFNHGNLILTTEDLYNDPQYDGYYLYPDADATSTTPTHKATSLTLSTAYANCYQDMSVLSFPDTYSIMGGVLNFYTNTNGYINEIVYNFNKIGNTVHCHFHGIINSYRIYYCANRQSGRASSQTKAMRSYTGTGSTFTKHYLYTSPAQNGPKKVYPADMNGQNINKYVIVDIFPPVSYVTLKREGLEIKYYTNIKNLHGTVKCFFQGDSNEYMLDYGSGELGVISDNQAVYSMIPPIKVKSVIEDYVSVSSMNDRTPGVMVSDGKLLISMAKVGSSSAVEADYIAEIDGSFTYILDVEEIHHHRRRDNDYSPTTDDPDPVTPIDPDPVTPVTPVTPVDPVDPSERD